MNNLEKLQKQENLEQVEGCRGVENLAKVCRLLGHKDPTYFGQFQGGCLGDLINFLENNSGAVESVLEFISENYDSELGELVGEDERSESNEFDPENGDYSTSDHTNFYQYGKLVLTVPEDADYKEVLNNHMEENGYWPDVWFISDHGNTHRINIEE